MKIKALIASFSASFDDLVRKIENHEAVADCVIQDVREAAAKIHSQRNLVQARLTRQQQKEQTLELDCQRWRERALACRDKDEDKALRCMQALKQSQRSLETLRQQICDNQKLIADLEAHLFNVEQRLSEIQNKRESLSARSARNKVEACAARSVNVYADVGIFERWETQVISEEYRHTGGANLSASDNLDREFRKQEDRAALLAELENLGNESLDNENRDKVINDKHTGGARHENA